MKKGLNIIFFLITFLILSGCKNRDVSTFELSGNGFYQELTFYHKDNKIYELKMLNTWEWNQLKLSEEAITDEVQAQVDKINKINGAKAKISKKDGKVIEKITIDYSKVTIADLENVLPQLYTNASGELKMDQIREYLLKYNLFKETSASNSKSSGQESSTTITSPTTQADNKQSKLKQADNQQSNANSNEQNSSHLPKDGEATYKINNPGGSTTLQYFFKDDIVYKQIGIYTYDPKGLGKSDEEVVQFLNKSQALYEGVTGIKYTVEQKDGKYIQTITFDYQTIDWRELYKRAPDRYPAKEPKPLKFSDAAANLVKNGFVKQ